MKKRTSKISKKKKIIILAVALLVVGVVTFGVVYFLNNNNKSTDTTQNISVKQSADDLKIEAMHILYSDPVKSKEILLQAKEKYTEINDVPGLVDIESQLQLIEYEAAHSTAN